MDKFQRKMAREIKSFMKRAGVSESEFRDVRRLVRFNESHQQETPCENCDNPSCRNPNKVYICAEQR
jgi:hypothetical protein